MRKKIIKLLFALTIAVPLTSCKSQEEIELERATKAYEEAKERADQAQKDYENLVDTLNEYEEVRDKLNGK